MSVPYQIKVVSLREAAARRARFSAFAAATSLHWEYLDAEEGLTSALVYDPEEAGAVSGRPLDRGELGCYASHVKAWSEFLSSDQQFLVVLEDDIFIDWPVLELLLENTGKLAGVEYLKLFAKIPAPYRVIRVPFLTQYHTLISYSDHSLGTQAYILSRSGASRLIERTRKVIRPIDVEMGRTWSHGLANHALIPFPVVELWGRSSIGESRLAPPPNRGIARRIRRGLEKARRILYRARQLVLVRKPFWQA